MKNLITAIIFAAIFIGYAHAGSDLKGICNSYRNGTYLENQRLQKVNLSGIWNPHESYSARDLENALNVTVGENSYSFTLQSEGRQLVSVAQAAFYLEQPVNLCVHEGYLLGLEIFKK